MLDTIKKAIEDKNHEIIQGAFFAFLGDPRTQAESAAGLALRIVELSNPEAVIQVAHDLVVENKELDIGRIEELIFKFLAASTWVPDSQLKPLVDTYRDSRVINITEGVKKKSKLKL